MAKALTKINPKVTTAAAPKAPRATLGVAGNLAVKLDRVAQRFEKMAKKMTGWSNIDDDGEDLGKATVHSIAASAGCLRTASNALRAIPKEWTPTSKRGGGGGPKAALKEGTLVAIRDKAMSKYADAFSNSEGKHLVVERVGALVVCRTKSGDRVFLKRGDLVLITPAE